MPGAASVASPDFLMLSPTLPASEADNAGARYVSWVVESVTPARTALVVVPDGAAARRGLDGGRVPEHVLVPTAPRLLPHPVGGLLGRLLTVLVPVRRPWAQVRAARRDDRVRQAIRAAAIIDLQWEEHGLLIPMIRRMNPEARVVCTLHDVLSQRYGRAAASSGSRHQRLRWAWARSRARSLERRIVARADAVVVFSEKDACLLPPGRAEVHVVHPPVEAGLGAVERTDAAQPTVLFVGFLARWENEEGLLWFLREVWPAVSAQVPEAGLRVAGLGASTSVRAAAASAGVELLGFVPDLEALYADASLVVVPLRLGAGVKFKVVEALIAGVPVVTTSVGAEGIGDGAWFQGVHDDAEGFASAVVAALAHPVDARARAESFREAARERYGVDQFRDSLSRVYPLGTGRR